MAANKTNQARAEKIAALRQKMSVKDDIVGDKFVGEFPDGTVLELEFSLSLDDIAGLGGSEVEQLRTLFERVGGKSAADTFSAQPMISATDFATKYFAAYSELQGVELGE